MSQLRLIQLLNSSQRRVQQWSPSQAGHLPVLLCPATGVPQSYYFKFCTWLSEQGYDVLVFDYRGIGKFLHGHVRDSEARFHTPFQTQPRFKLMSSTYGAFARSHGLTRG